MSAITSVPGVDYCGECGMDWHQPRRQGWHYPDCPRYHAATNAPDVDPVPDTPEDDDGMP